MKAKPSEWQRQARAGREANIHKASFIERRPFYLTRYCVVVPTGIFSLVNLDIYVVSSKCNKGTR